MQAALDEGPGVDVAVRERAARQEAHVAGPRHLRAGGGARHGVHLLTGGQFSR